MTGETLERRCEVRSQNWLPLPPEAFTEAEAAAPVEEEDGFPKGSVGAFYPRQGIGTLAADRGGVFPFRLSEVELVGARSGECPLKAGARVGFDLSQSSHGLRISKIKVYR